jgi:transmembrane sensor
MRGEEITALLERYGKGQTISEENERIERWLEANDKPDSAWDTLERSAKDRWLTAVFTDIRHTIRAGQGKVVTLPKRKTSVWRSIAAAAAVLIISFGLYLEWPAIQQTLHPVQLSALKVPENLQKQVTLADGSQVWVNAGSELRYPKVFNGKIREVYLSGEAYFDIAHDATHPFIIHTGNVITTVLGTAFNIREDQNAHTIEVTVTRGKVSVSNGAKLLGILTPNQQISFNTTKSTAIKENVNAQQVIAWQQSDLHFEDVSFADAAAQLQQHFNVRISFSNDHLKNCRFTGTSIKGEQLDNILKVMCAFNNASYQRKADGSILIDGAGCNE